jgi:glycosyltransferase involved in cell wall biosynthesis
VEKFAGSMGGSLDMGRPDYNIATRARVPRETRVTGPPLLYVSFDQVPAPKGASTHIEAFAAALGLRYGSLILVTPGPDDDGPRPLFPGVRQIVLGCPDADVLGRVLTFRAKLLALLRRQSFRVIHFRSPFEGYPLALQAPRLDAGLLYEVNGLPSIELKYGYPRLERDDVLRIKLEQQERACWDAADRIIAVSGVTASCLIERGCASSKIAVIPNGVDPELFPYRDPLPLDDGPMRLLYSGTLSPWQGVDVLLEALPLVRAQRFVSLTIAGPAAPSRRDELERRAQRLGVTDEVRFAGSCPRGELARMLHEHHATVVPLTAADRNTVQGCCPLKLLEALAAGCPVVASDLPVVRELVEPETHILTTAPGDAAALAAALLGFAADADRSQARCRRACDHVCGRFTWRHSIAALMNVYRELLDS